MILDIYINGEFYAMTEEKDYGTLATMLKTCRDRFIVSQYMPRLDPKLVSVIPGGSVYMGWGEFERLPVAFELKNVELNKELEALFLKF